MVVVVAEVVSPSATVGTVSAIVPVVVVPVTDTVDDETVGGDTVGGEGFENSTFFGEG